MTSLAVVSLNAVQGTHAFAGKAQLPMLRTSCLPTRCVGPRLAGDVTAGRHSTGADVLQRVDAGEPGRLPASPAWGLDAARVQEAAMGMTRAAVEQS